MGAGAIVGELSLLNDGPRSATVVADTDCRVLLIPRDRFIEFVRANPDVALKLLRNLAHRVRVLDHLLGDE